jgi:sulfur carrier protein ThiS
MFHITSAFKGFSSMNCTVSFRLYEELNDYVSPERRKASFSVTFKDPVTIRDAICSLGVPAEEIDLVLVNSEPVPFDHIIADGNMISIYPIFESLDISGVTRLRDKPLIRLARAFKNPRPERSEKWQGKGLTNQ